MDTNSKKEITSSMSQTQSSALGFIHKKTERLVTAVYMLSNFFPNQEPLKWKVRDIGLHLLEDISNVFYMSTQDSRNTGRECSKMIDEIIGLFDLARASNFISPMNFSVLRDEFLSLKRSIEAQSSRGVLNELMITTDFFMSEKVSDKTLPEGGVVSEPQKESLPTHPQGNMGVSSMPVMIQAKAKDGVQVPVNENRNTSIQSSVNLERKNSEREKRHQAQPNKHLSQRKNNRSEAILKILGKKDNLTVKDIAQVISDCSEKTIQRELLSLVSQNVLKKVGERRWSRYSLA